MLTLDALGLIIDVVALLLSVGYVLLRFRDRRIVIDHRILFTIGHAYYLAIGSIMARLRLLDDKYDLRVGHL